MTTFRSSDHKTRSPLSSIALVLLLSVFALGVACAEPAAETAADTSAETLAEPAITAVSETGPGLIHTVFFWLRDDLTDEERTAFVEGNRAMAAIPSIRNLYFGPPAPTEARDVVDNTYDYALILHFDDLAGQDAYQVHPMHKQMIEDHGDKWTRVVVYDSEVMN